MSDLIDFKGLAKAALNQSEALLKKWLPNGKKVVGEWKSKNPTRSDNHEGSFSVNIITGRWGDFATGDVGNDLVSLCAYINHDGDQVAAAKELARELNMPEAVPKLRGRGKPKQVSPAAGSNPAPPPAEPPAPPPAPPVPDPDDKGKWVPIMPVPEGVPAAPVAQEYRGIPSAHWTYRDVDGQLLGYIARFEKSCGGKEIAPLTYCEHSKSGLRGWRWVGFPEPRPLYGLEKLAAYPLAAVLLVEGEKCADAAQQEFSPEQVITLTWPGGANAIDKADFSPLTKRKVMTLADCDMKRRKPTKAEKEAGVDPATLPLLPEDEQPGVKAMRKAREKLHALGGDLWNVAIPKPGEKPDGWDIADAIEEGLKGQALAEWLAANTHAWQPAAAQLSPPPDDAPPPDESPVDDDWYSRLHRTDKGRIAAVTANVFDVLSNAIQWQGVIAYDEHAQRVVKLRQPPYASGKAGEWDDQDDTQTAMWLTRRYHFAPTNQTVLEAVEALSKIHAFNPVQDYLNSLLWDGEKRIGNWLIRYLGVEPKTDSQREYLKRAGAWFLMGMVARAMRPGCKFDYCLVLEGDQGKRKSTVLNRLVGDAWFGDTDLDLTNKDAMVSLQGKWLYEIAEMGAIARSEEKRQKSFLSRRTDEFRPHYGRRNVKLPRQLVFAGTTNEWEWNKDPTGGRRFWPVMVVKIDPEGISADRDQLFAEAMHYFKEGHRYWPTEEEQLKFFDPEQLQRELFDSLVDGLHDWVYKQVSPFSAYTAMSDGLKMDAAKMTRDVQTRVGIALRKLGCRKFEKRNGMTRFWYEPPKKDTEESVPSSETETPESNQSAAMGVSRAGF